MTSPGHGCAICGATYDPNALYCPRDGAPLGARAPKGPDPFLGIELPGQIVIERLIGIGSMGRVYLAEQRGLGRHVAVKILHEELSRDPTLVARFRREAEIASRLCHPNVVQALLAGQVPAEGRQAGAMYIAMEYLDGISLRSALAAAGGALALPRAMRIILQLCEAVGEAHGAGVVHRDLKPENVMLLKRSHDDDFVKVLDFGIARLPGGNTPTVTKAGAVFGTARYVSPEGAMGSPVGPAADVYAIATILYQALAGRTPFDGDSAVEILSRQIDDPPPPLGSIERARDVPAPLVATIMKNLAKRAEERSPDARALGVSLVLALRASGLSPERFLPHSALFAASPATAPVAASHATASFAAIERTRQQTFAADGHFVPDAPVADEIRGVSGPSSTPRGRGPLMLIIGCVAAGAALAALASYRSQEPAAGGAATETRSAGTDAGRSPDSGP